MSTEESKPKTCGRSLAVYQVRGGRARRRAYELAFSACYMFGGARPVFVEVDRVTFQSPVSVGNLLRFKSHVLHTQRQQDDPTQVPASPQYRAHRVVFCAHVWLHTPFGYDATPD